MEIYYTFYIKTVILFFYIFILLIIFSFCLKWKNLIGLLLTLEIFILCLIIYLLNFIYNLSIFYVVVIILISEAIIGLSLLIINIRFFGNDFSNNYIW